MANTNMKTVNKNDRFQRRGFNAGLNLIFMLQSLLIPSKIA